MFSGAKVVCDVCHMQLQSKEYLAKDKERHHKLPFRLKGTDSTLLFTYLIIFGVPGKKLSKRPHSPDQELPSPTYTAKYKLVPGTVPSEGKHHGLCVDTYYLPFQFLPLQWITRRRLLGKKQAPRICREAASARE